MSSNHRGRIVVIGSTNVDFIMQTPTLPAKGETVTDGRFLQAYGGKGANQAVAAARAGNPSGGTSGGASGGGAVTFVTCLGEDLYAPRLLQSFERDGIDTAHVKRERGVTTGTALIMFDARGDNCIAVAPGANDRLLPDDADRCAGLIADAGIILLNMEIPAATLRRVLEIARERGTRVLFNYAPIRGGAVEVSDAMTGLIVNEQEAAALAGASPDSLDSLRDAASRLRAKGPRFVIVTLGSQGAIVADERGMRTVPAFTVEPIDTTAAGDTFCGTLGVALGEGKGLDDAVRFAAAAAALCVTRVGAQPSIPNRPEIDAFLDRRPGA